LPFWSGFRRKQLENQGKGRLGKRGNLDISQKNHQSARVPSNFNRYVVWRPNFLDSDLCRRHAMLVLSRKLGEKIWIGEHIVVTVVQIDNNRVRLGIEAPRSVPIWRSELIVEKDEKDLASRVTLVEVGGSGA
jgi:carbon storage regulator